MNGHLRARPGAWSSSAIRIDPCALVPRTVPDGVDPPAVEADQRLPAPIPRRERQPRRRAGCRFSSVEYRRRPRSVSTERALPIVFGQRPAGRQWTAAKPQARRCRAPAASSGLIWRGVGSPASGTSPAARQRGPCPEAERRAPGRLTCSGVSVINAQEDPIEQRPSVPRRGDPRSDNAEGEMGRRAGFAMRCRQGVIDPAAGYALAGEVEDRAPSRRTPSQQTA